MKKLLIGIWSYPLQWILYFFTYIVMGVNFITGWIFRIGAIVAFIVDFVNLCNGTHNFGIFCAWFALILFIFLIPWFFELLSNGGAALIGNISYWRSNLFYEFDEKKRKKQINKMEQERREAREEKEAHMTEEEKAEQKRIEREQVNNTMRQLKQVAKEYEQKEREAQRR